jgi:nucleotidyltransferase substrate binding protein (TIGR01987 family)
MEKLKVPQQLLYNALKTYKKVFEGLEKARLTNDALIIEMAQDSCIQRFEYCFDSFWKFLKRYLEGYYELENINSPRSVFEACVKQKLCSEQQGEQLVLMLEDRNITTHTYDAEKVRRIFPRVLEYYSLMKDIVDSLPTVAK